MELSDDAKRDIEKMVVKATEKMMDAAIDHAKGSLNAASRHVEQSHQLASVMHANAVSAAIEESQSNAKKK